MPIEGVGELAGCDLDDGLQIHRDPRLLADRADADLDLPERGLDRGRPVLAGDGGCPASDEPAPADHHPLAGARPLVGPADDHGECPREQDSVFERRPVSHRSSPSA